MSSKRNVGASAVREWFAGLDEADRFLTRKGAEPVALSVGKRGKLSDDVIEAYEKANRRVKYVPGFVESRKITGVREDANGRKRAVTVSATLSEVRAWAQSPEGQAAGVAAGERGRLSADTMAAFAARPVAKVAAAAPVAQATAQADGGATV